MIPATVPVRVPAVHAQSWWSGPARRYEHLYRRVARRFGRRAPGCNLLTGSCHVTATVVRLRASIGVLERFFTPPRTVTATPVAATASAQSTATVPTAAPSGGLVACIISHESGGSPTAVNGKYTGIGQWQPSTWLADGGGRYASSPLGASYSEQLAVLQGEGTAGMVSQQAQYDGCAG